MILMIMSYDSIVFNLKINCFVIYIRPLKSVKLELGLSAG